MRILMIGAGGVGDAAARIAVERDYFEQWVVADYDLARAQATVDAATARRPGEQRFVAAQVDASDEAAVASLALAFSLRQYLIRRRVVRSFSALSSLMPARHLDDASRTPLQ